MTSTAQKLQSNGAAFETLRADIAAATQRLEQAEARCREAAADAELYRAASDAEAAVRAELDTLRTREGHLAAVIRELEVVDLRDRIEGARAEIAKLDEAGLKIRDETLAAEQEAFDTHRRVKLEGHQKRQESFRKGAAARQLLEDLEQELAQQSGGSAPIALNRTESTDRVEDSQSQVEVMA